MSKADKMFLKIGYELFHEDEYSFSLFNKGEGRYITFVKDTKTLMLTTNVTIQELQAINKKVKELGWLDE